MEEIEGLHQRASLLEWPEPPLVDLDETRSVERGEGAVHPRLKGVVPATHHEPVRLVRELLSAQPELRRALGGGQQAREQETIRGVGVEPPLLESPQALTDL